MRMDPSALRWEQEKFVKNLTARLERNMAAAMRFAASKAKDSLGITNQHGLAPSRPGEPPHLGRGTLRRSVAGVSETVGTHITGTLGVLKGNAEQYARRLELGFVGRPKRHPRQGKLFKSKRRKSRKTKEQRKQGRHLLYIRSLRRQESGFVSKGAGGGIVDQAPRPYLRRVLWKYPRELARIIVKGTR